MNDKGTMTDRERDDDSINHPGQSDISLKTNAHITSNSPATVLIPCHHIRLGDFLMLHDRPCQVIRISTNSATEQYRYLGVDLFTKELREASSFTSNPAPSVSIQTMKGPIFKQYRLLEITDGQIVALTETGDIKHGISVLDQSNLYSRLQQAFDSGRGSVRMLVLRDNNREVAVDMKIIHGLILSDSEPDQRFQEGVRGNDKAIVQEALAMGANINALDDEGRTALFTALDNHNSEVIDLLLDHKINLEVADKSGKTVLDMSVKDSGLYITTFILLGHGATPTKDLDYGISELLLAAAAGDNENIERLLEEGVKLSSCDRLGYTALHEAACFGRYDTAKLLILKGATVDEKIKHGGATALHSVIQRGREHREFLTGHRRATPQPTEDHVRVVALLLQHGADITCTRQHDSRTMQDPVTGELMSRSLRTKERWYHEKILILLKNDSSQVEIDRGPTWPRVQGVSHTESDRLKKIQLQVHYRTPSNDLKDFNVDAESLIQESTDNDERPSLRTWATRESNSYQSEGHWRWIHLPANNKVWAEHAICQLSGMDNETLKMYRSGINAFTTESYHEIRGAAQHACLRQPSFTPLLGSRGGIFSLVIPYLDSENLDCLINHYEKKTGENHSKKKSCETVSCKDNFEKEETSKKLYQTTNRHASFHAPVTLDQSYYLFLQDSKKRDKDQVVVKYVERQESGQVGAGPGRPKRLLMVNQMWVWKVDAVTVVTAFPDRKHPSQSKDPNDSNLSKRVFKILKTSPPFDIDLLMLRLLRDVIGFVDEPAKAGLSENVFHIFQQSIAYRTQEDANCYANFNSLQNKLSGLETEKAWPGASKAPNTKMTEIETQLCNITKEVEHLCEIKDIKDELKMIQQVLEDQKNVLDQYASVQEELNFGIKKNQSNVGNENISKDDGYQLFLETKSLLELRIAKVKSLFTDASSVENSLNRLLDLKQKHGNLIVVRDTRRLADEAEKRVKHGEWQSKLLFTFTIVTVVFTPISFVSSFMAVPTQEFPHTDEDEVSWKWWQVFAASSAVELLTLLVIAPWVEWHHFVWPWTRPDSQERESTKIEERRQTLSV